MDKVENELDRLSHHMRAAFAAACAQRVLSIYKYTAQGDVIRRGPSVAIETAWSFAEGAEVDEKRIHYAKDEVNRAFPEPELGGGADHFAVAAAAYALDAIEDETAKSASLAAGRACDAIAQIDELDGVEEEKDWQRHALQIAKEWGKQPIRRDMFDVLGTQKPRWLLRFE
jgi:hypothetical protein